MFSPSFNYCFDLGFSQVVTMLKKPELITWRNKCVIQTRQSFVTYRQLLILLILMFKISVVSVNGKNLFGAYRGEQRFVVKVFTGPKNQLLPLEFRC